MQVKMCSTELRAMVLSIHLSIALMPHFPLEMSPREVAMTDKLLTLSIQTLPPCLIQNLCMPSWVQECWPDPEYATIGSRVSLFYAVTCILLSLNMDVQDQLFDAFLFQKNIILLLFYICLG